MPALDTLEITQALWHAVDRLIGRTTPIAAGHDRTNHDLPAAGVNPDYTQVYGCIATDTDVLLLTATGTIAHSDVTSFGERCSDLMTHDQDILHRLVSVVGRIVRITTRDQSPRDVTIRGFGYHQGIVFVLVEGMLTGLEATQMPFALPDDVSAIEWRAITEIIPVAANDERSPVGPLHVADLNLADALRFIASDVIRNIVRVPSTNLPDELCALAGGASIECGRIVLDPTCGIPHDVRLIVAGVSVGPAGPVLLVDSIIPEGAVAAVAVDVEVTWADIETIDVLVEGLLADDDRHRIINLVEAMLAPTATATLNTHPQSPIVAPVVGYTTAPLDDSTIFIALSDTHGAELAGKYAAVRFSDIATISPHPTRS